MTEFPGRIDFTDEQLALLPEIREEWTAALLSTEPADRPTTEEGVRKAYLAAGLKPPGTMVWLDSPIAGAWVAGAARSRSEEWLHDPAHRRIATELRTMISISPLSVALGHKPIERLSQQFDPFPFDPAPWSASGEWLSLLNGTRVSLQARVNSSISHAIEDRTSFDCDWVSDCVSCCGTSSLIPYGALKRFGFVTRSELAGHAQAARNAGWWWSFPDMAIITERPLRLDRDKEGRLHSDNGPAMLYRDGVELNYWHGTRVPADLVRGLWDVARILGEENTEIRRCAIEHMGWDRFIAKAELQPTSEPVPDPGNAPHTLQLFDLPPGLSDMYEESARILLCTNGSPERDGSTHRFGLVVPARHNDPIAAAADLYDIPPGGVRGLAGAAVIQKPTVGSKWQRKDNGREDTVTDCDDRHVTMYSPATNRHWHVELGNFYRKYEEAT